LTTVTEGVCFRNEPEKTIVEDLAVGVKVI